VYCTVDRVVLCLNEESLPHPMEMTELAREHIAATRAGYGAWYLSRIVSCATPNRDATDAIAGISRRASSTCCTPVGGGGPSWRPLLLAAADGLWLRSNTSNKRTNNIKQQINTLRSHSWLWLWLWLWL
jgi:hypothetical protein